MTGYIFHYIFFLSSFLSLMKNKRKEWRNVMEVDDLWSYVPIPDIIYFSMFACDTLILFFHFFAHFSVAQAVIIFSGRMNYCILMNVWMNIGEILYKRIISIIFFFFFNDVCRIIHFFTVLPFYSFTFCSLVCRCFKFISNIYLWCMETVQMKWKFFEFDCGWKGNIKALMLTDESFCVFKFLIFDVEKLISGFKLELKSH